MGFGYDNSIYECLVKEFRQLDNIASKKLAHHLTEQINNALIQNNRKVIFNRAYISNECAESLMRLSVQPLSVSLPWRAYYDAKSNTQRSTFIDGLQSILVTIPDEYSLNIPISSQFGHPYSGSLIQRIADLINDCHSTLLIVNPYWGKNGIDQLKLRIKNYRFENRKAMILLPYKLDAENLLGLETFVSFLKQVGFATDIKIPKTLSDGTVPFVHAKVIIADSQLAYIGSANMSLNGFRKSIEVGVILEGTPANHLQIWMMNLSSKFFSKYPEE